MKLDANNIFAVISEPRTGSTVLIDQLELLDGVSCQGEIFHPDQIHSGLDKESIPDLKQRDDNPVDFLQKMSEQTYEQRGGAKLIGFKLFFDHNPVITDYLLRNGIPIILLERVNKLAQYSSLKIAKRTGLWNSGDKISKEQEELNRKRGKKVRFSLLEFIAYSIRSRYRFNQLIGKINRCHTPCYYVTYENMLDANEWKNIVKFLGIETSDINVKSSYQKQNTGSLFNRFSNDNYAYYCCKFIYLFPFLPKLLSLTPDLLVRAE